MLVEVVHRPVLLQSDGYYITRMIRNIFNRISRRQEVIEGARIRLKDFRGLPFNNGSQNLTRMFELRDWFIQNTTSNRIANKYSEEMATLHHELNFTTSNIALRRMLLFAAAWIAILLTSSEPAQDWRDEFDLKYQRKIYGALEEGASEGG